MPRSRYPFLAQRPDEERATLRAMSAAFLAQKEFHGAGGLVITDEIALAIAAQAVPRCCTSAWAGTTISSASWCIRTRCCAPQHMDESGVVHDWDEVLAGEAMEGGPVMLNWQDVAQAGDTADTGYNVVIHEFVHKIDLRDGAPDGCPPLASREARRHWLEVLEPQYRQFREQVIKAERFGEQAPWLDDYGATAIDEFFAVACELFREPRPVHEGVSGVDRAV